MRENAEYIASNDAVNIALWHTMPVPHERDVLHAADFRNEAADAVSQRKHVQKWVRDIAEAPTRWRACARREGWRADRQPAQGQLGMRSNATEVMIERQSTNAASIARAGRLPARCV